MINSIKQPITYKIFLFGDVQVGKTSFILRMSEGTFEESMVSTMGCDSKKKHIVLENNQEAIVEMWDTAGQDRFKSITRNLIKKADGVILVYSIIDRTSFENVTQWLADVKMMGQANIPIILVGNKSDMSNERLVSEKEGNETAEKNDILFFEASCKDDINISKIFKQLVKSIYAQKKKVSTDQKERISIIQSDFVKKKKKFC